MKRINQTYVVPRVTASLQVLLETEFLQGASVFHDTGPRATGQEVDEYSTAADTDWDYLITD